MMFKSTILTCAIVFTTSSFALGKYPSQTGNYCKDDVFRYLNEKFDGNYRIKKLQQVNLANGSLEFWVTTDKCDGQLVMDFGGIKKLICGSAHYGSRPRYLDRVWATRKCRSVFPRDDYPSFEWE